GAIECEALRFSLHRADDAEIAALLAYLDGIEPEYERCGDPVALVQMDQTFHVRLAGLSGNHEFVRTLQNVNDRIRYVRMIDLKALREARAASAPSPQRLSAHRQVIEAVEARDEAAALAARRTHIERRGEQTTAAVRDAFAQIYVMSD